MYSAKLTDIVSAFQVEAVLPEIDISNKVINRKEINRPALQLTGFYHRFDHDRIQVIGRVEHGYLSSLSDQERDDAIRHLFEYYIPCLFISKNLEVFPEMITYGKKYDVPIFRTSASTTEFTAELIMWLRAALADRVMMHGVFIDIYGEGVLITGDSGIGKSETALELIKRGHRLIADDAVEIKKISNRNLLGSCPELIRYLIEVRGIGIINVKELFGIGAVKEEETIDMVLKLEMWDGTACSYDRLGLEDEYMKILGTNVLCRTIPIRPGRNVAVICESAAISNRQRKMGENTALSFEKKVKETNS
ncbi:MAG: HPr(Ser) kinase/phosphatase [Bacillota bacterium]